MPSSFGSMLSEAAKQSRLAREEDEKRQLAMLQAGFVPKPQPEAPPQQGGMLSNVLPSLKRTYGYQPQFQASDYQLGEHHPAKMAEAQRAHEKAIETRFDAERREEYNLRNNHQEMVNNNLKSLQRFVVPQAEAELAGIQAVTDKTIADTGLIGERVESLRAEQRQTQAQTELINLQEENARARLEDWQELSGYREILRTVNLDKLKIEAHKAGFDVMRTSDGRVFIANFINGSVKELASMKGDKRLQEQQIGANLIEAYSQMKTLNPDFMDDDEYEAKMKEVMETYFTPEDPEVEAIILDLTGGGGEVPALNPEEAPKEEAPIKEVSTKETDKELEDAKKKIKKTGKNVKAKGTGGYIFKDGEFVAGRQFQRLLFNWSHRGDVKKRREARGIYKFEDAYPEEE
jgi:hypothetical protein